MRLAAFAASLLMLASSALAQQRPTTPESWEAAQRTALEKIYAGHQFTFYCNCPYALDGTLMEGACGYEAREPTTASGEINARAHRVEWDHVVPVARFGQGRACWEARESFAACRKPDGSPLSQRDCCYAVDAEFRAMHDDLQNLRPAIGELKADKGELPYGTVEGETRDYGACDFEVDDETVEPAAEDRGRIARAFFYMERVWRMQLSQSERDLFETWASADPPDSWELERDRRIEIEQGMGSPVFGDLDETACRERANCCRICSDGQACGDVCIGVSTPCGEPPGCACDAVGICAD
jgi:deoxyribonuclease-1